MSKKSGSRAEVYHGTALQTPGGLRKKDLYKNKRGRIVSMKKSKSAKSWNPLKMLGLLSSSGDPFGAKTIYKGFRKGSISKTRKGRSGQPVQDFVTHKGTKIKRNGKKYKGYFARKGSVRRTNKQKLGRDYSQSGGITGITQPLNYANYPSPVADFSKTNPVFINNPEQRALMAASGGKKRGGGLTPLAMTQLDQGYPSQISNNFQARTPLSEALTAAA
uniref:Uncharacterized protein n=1 Tax=viral metagenome TaxID=1070528 RepID=A0A6C0HRL9_9ZZZZ